MKTKLILITACLFWTTSQGNCAAPPPAKVPGVVIDHIPASTGVYIGSPCIAILPNGDYVVSHDHFGPKSTEHTRALTAIFRSADRGRTWRKVSEVQGAFWPSLFVHRGALYLLGPDRHYGNILIRRSTDGGSTWTTPASSTTGVLSDKGEYHCAPTPVIEHAGRLWRGFEWRHPPIAWGINYRATMLSAPVDADLLNAASWTLAEPLPSDRSWNGRDMGAWLEGNAVVTPAGELVDILRVQTKSPDEKAAIVRVSADGKKLSFDPATGFVDFPGGAKKFSIRFDSRSKLYWSLASIILERHRADNPGGVRNTLALTCSPDLIHWTVRCILLHHPEVKKHGFQYVDWLFDGDDIIAANRTAYDDGQGGAHNFHDANYLTFHRITNFRKKTMADSVPITEQPPVSAGTADIVVTGSGWTLATLADNQKAFGNRSYVWKNVPEKFRGWGITQTSGGERAEIRVKAKRDMTLFAATNAAKQPAMDLTGWNTVASNAFYYDDKGKTPITIYCRALKAGKEITVPQGNWTGMMVLLPPDGTSVAALVALGQPLERLKHNNPGLVVDLGVGLWAWPLPMDFDGDGDLDLVVNCSDKPYNGVYFFENASGDTAKNKMPVFKPARRISKGMQNVQVSYVDGKPRVLSPATEYHDFLKTGLENGVKLSLPVNIHPNKVRANMWRLVDYDGDGALDITVGVGDWTDYGWDNAYTASGTWTNGPLRGFVYVLRNTGSNVAPAYDKPTKVMAGDKPVETFGWPSPNFADFDGDGDLDLLCGEFLDGFTHFENIGTRTAPKYAPGKRLKDADGKPLVMDLQMVTPTAIDWDQDGDLDLIVGDEDGRVAFIENTGKLRDDHTPVFLAPRYFQQEADEMKFGALATPCGCDWDGDGDTDIICGNTAGYIAFFENLSGPGVEKPKWAAPKYLKADGKVIRFMAGPNGSIQGPCEAKWGYTTQTVADWNGDGLPDIIVNSIWGKVVWFKNIGTRKAPKLAAAQPIEVEWDGPQPTLAYGWLRPKGKELLTQWRTTPVMVDWNKDGLTDLVMLDHEGYLAFFERARRDGKLVLLHPKRVFCDDKGEPLRLNVGIAGRSGRRKLCIVDWDGDGKLDILANAANARFLRQVESRDGKWFFKDM
ncbi:MAG: hypothetical protein WC740_13640, partial [Verrucomicrobiia bacterium]